MNNNFLFNIEANKFCILNALFLNLNAIKYFVIKIKYRLKLWQLYLSSRKTICSSNLNSMNSFTELNTINNLKYFNMLSLKQDWSWSNQTGLYLFKKWKYIKIKIFEFPLNNIYKTFIYLFIHLFYFYFFYH